ncbi:hypothetical protein AO369_0150 [Moraxella catarrhalis]|nr:hypothetical protein [Moraxella catarrhalis]OAV29528.1 hypothetical protein AO369_0150 [Moraxella catarrhalis]
MKKYQTYKLVKRSLINNFIQCIERLIQNNACNQIIANELLKWINDNEVELVGTIFDKVYGILQYKDLNVLNYPISYTNHMDIVRSLENCIKFRANTETLAMILRDCLEGLFFLETNFICANCKTSGLIVVKEKDLLYECRSCSFLQDLNGDKYTPSEVLTIPTISDLKQIGQLIK